MEKVERNISTLLVVATVFVAPLVFSLACTIGKVEVFGLAGMSCLWIMLPFSVIPISALVFGLVYCRRDKKALKNVITGSVVAFLMIAMGLSSFAVENDRTGSFLENASTKTGIILPQKVDSAAYSDYDGIIGNAVILDPNEKSLFEDSINNDGRWLNDLTPVSKGILPPFLLLELTGFDKHCLYVEPINSFNPVSLSSGDYVLTLLSYKESKSQLRVFYDYKVIV